MRQVGVVVVLAIVAATAATLLIQSSREQAASLEQARSQHEELMQRLARLEHMLAATSADPSDALHTFVSQGSNSAAVSARERSTKDAEAADIDAQRLAEHAARIQAGSAIVDHAIQTGQWSLANIAAFGSATSALSGEETAAVMARLSVAINADQVQLDMRPRAQ
jgi:type II secretory pathway pseudopilin PulG